MKFWENSHKKFKTNSCLHLIIKFDAIILLKNQFILPYYYLLDYVFWYPVSNKWYNQAHWYPYYELVLVRICLRRNDSNYLSILSNESIWKFNTPNNLNIDINMANTVSMIWDKNIRPAMLWQFLYKLWEQMQFLFFIFSWIRYE